MLEACLHTHSPETLSLSAAGVIIVPTRELGLQVAGVLKQLAAGAPSKVGLHEEYKP